MLIMFLANVMVLGKSYFNASNVHTHTIFINLNEIGFLFIHSLYLKMIENIKKENYTTQPFTIQLN